jgi:hypothetical protein
VETVILSDERENGEVRWFETPLGGGASKEILADVYVHKYFTDTYTGRLIGYQQEEIHQPIPSPIRASKRS